MTLLLRKIETYQAWMKGGAGLDSDSLGDVALPIWAVREFIPRQGEEKGISFFEIERDEDAEVIAGAFSFNTDKLNGGQVAFMSIETNLLRDAGFKVEITPGRIRNRFANERHRDVLLVDFAEIFNLTRLFLKHGNPQVFEGKTCGKAARSSARRSEFDYSNLIAQDERERGGKHLLQFVHEKVVHVSGIQLSSPPAASEMPRS